MGCSSSVFTQQEKYKFVKVSQKFSQASSISVQQRAILSSDHTILLQIIKKHSLLSILTDKQRMDCSELFIKWAYGRGRYIYRQHDTPEELFLIESGIVSVEIDCSIVKELGDREYFGHDTVCFDSPRSESIRVVSPEVVVFAIRKDKIMPIIQERMSDYKQDINSMFNRIHFFNYLTNKQRRFLINSTQLFRLNPGEVLFEKEQDANSFYVVRKNTITIQIDSKKDIIMREGDYFGQSAFLQLLHHSNKSQRMGRAIAEDGAEVYAIGLSPVKVCLGYYIRSIIFFNQEKWALFRNEYINSLTGVDYNYLLQLFNVKQGKKYSLLAKKGTRPKYIFIPLEVEINKCRDLKIYGSELIASEQQVINYDIILTQNGYYAYALIDEVREVLSLKSSTYSSQIQIKLLKQPLYMNLTLTLRNLSKFSKRLSSSDYSVVLIVQDMKFGNEFIVKIYKKKTKINPTSYKCLPDLAPTIPSRKTYKLLRLSNDLSVKPRACIASKTSLKSIFPNPFQNVENGKILLDEQIVRRQKNIAAELCHNYFCGYYKAQEDQNNYYLFFEYIVGTKLEDVIGDFGKLPYKLSKYYLASIAHALHFMHSSSIVYRNLNPNDIIIKNNGRLVIVDFSCAKKLGNSQKTSTLIGTPYYMAPQIIEEQQYSFSSDIWSMGVILYEMITGMLPFGVAETDPIDIYNAVLANQPNLDLIQEKKEKDLILRLLQKDPEKRIQKALDIRNYEYICDLQFGWDQFLKGEMQPPYYPPIIKSSFTNMNNYQIFDASSVADWD